MTCCSTNCILFPSFVCCYSCILLHAPPNGNDVLLSWLGGLLSEECFPNLADIGGGDRGHPPLRPLVHMRGSGGAGFPSKTAPRPPPCHFRAGAFSVSVLVVRFR